MEKFRGSTLNSRLAEKCVYLMINPYPSVSKVLTFIVGTIRWAMRQNKYLYIVTSGHNAT